MSYIKRLKEKRDRLLVKAARVQAKINAQYDYEILTREQVRLSREVKEMAREIDHRTAVWLEHRCEVPEPRPLENGTIYERRD